MTPDRERELRDYVDRCADEPDEGYPPIEWGDLRGLIAALDAERAEVERIRARACCEEWICGCEWHAENCAMGHEMDQLRDERDQARLDAVALWDLRAPGAVPDGDTCARVGAYREELDGKS